jgi:hypothetical protein
MHRAYDIIGGMSEFKIKRGIPVPKPKRKSWREAPLAKALVAMQIGDCIDIPIEGGTDFRLWETAKRLGVKTTARKMNKNVLRVWKVDDQADTAEIL